jgi:hypothetical protein
MEISYLVICRERKMRRWQDLNIVCTVGEGYSYSIHLGKDEMIYSASREHA